MMYTEVGFTDRFALAAKDGFAGVEFLFPYEHPARELRARLDAQGLTQALFNAPPGRPESGGRGLACLPGCEAEFRTGIELALEYADALGCPRIHLMAGVEAPDLPRALLRDTYLSNLAWAAGRASSQDVDVLIEPINRRDIPGYHLNRQDDAHAVVEAVGAKNLKVQMDLYHCQIVEGDVATKIRQYLPTGRVGHFQIAGVPERHEPNIGELHYPYLLDLIDEIAKSCAWQGWIGCEYRPRNAAAKGGTSAALGWMRPAWRDEGR